MAVRLDFGLAGPALTAGFPPTWVQRFEAQNHPEKDCCSKVHASEGMTPEEQQEFLWQQFFTDQSHWWDDRLSKPTPQHPDFRHKKCRVALWLDNRHKPTWVDTKLATWDSGAGVKSFSTAAQGQEAYGREGAVEVGMCRKLCEDGRLADAVDAVNLLVQRGCRVDNYIFYRVLKRCISQKDLVIGTRIHALALQNGYDGDPFLATHLMGLYASHGRLEDVMGVFTKVAIPSSYNWATVIFAYARHGEAAEAIRLYQKMRISSTVEPDNRIYVAVLTACAAAADLCAGKDVHSHIRASPEEPDTYVATALVTMYAKCGRLEDARRIFDRHPSRDVVTWNAMLAGYTQQAMGQQALSLYCKMKQGGIAPNYVTFLCILQACSSVGEGALDEGKHLHAQIEERGLQHDSVLGCSLVDMYAKCGSLEGARSVFDALKDRDVVTWNALLAGYAQQGMGQETLSLYNEMQQESLTSPDSVTYVCLLQACASVGEGALDQGTQLHAQIEERGFQVDVVVGNSLVNMYAQCGSLVGARSVFDRLPDRNVVTWTALIAGYVQQGMVQEALSVYSLMQEEGVTAPNSVTFVSLLQACANTAALPLGKQLHEQVEERGLQSHPGVGAALVNMYAKCGSMVDSQKVFDSLPVRTVEAWNALIGGYAHQGDSEVVFDSSHRMRLEGIQPNSITFVIVLTACSHVGLLDKGQKYFKAMTTHYGISPTVEHYTCMLGLLGRAGHLDEALQMAKSMSLAPDVGVWLTLLGACQKWNNVEIGLQAFEFAVRLDGKDAAPYVLMSNIYSSAHMWDEANAIQARRVELGAWKKQGQSWWTDMGGVVHSFAAGDNKYPESEGGTASPQKDQEWICCTPLGVVAGHI